MLGLEEAYFSGSDDVVGYRVGDLQISITRHPDATIREGWATQLGWEGGTAPETSWGIELDAEAFARAVEAAVAAGVESWSTEPQWVGYWSYVVRDPMGHTVEISTPALSER